MLLILGGTKGIDATAACPPLRPVELHLQIESADQETRLSVNYLRTYSPKNGRYMESDPAGKSGDSNSYVYVENAPLTSIDPMGMKRVERLAFEIERATPGLSGSEITMHQDSNFKIFVYVDSRCTRFLKRNYMGYKRPTGGFEIVFRGNGEMEGKTHLGVSGYWAKLWGFKPPNNCVKCTPVVSRTEHNDYSTRNTVFMILKSLINDELRLEYTK